MPDIITLEYAILLSVFALVAYYGFLRPGLSLAPWVATKGHDLARIDRLAALKPGGTFFEAGCGDGRVSAYIARENPEAIVVGVELSFIMYLVARVRAALTRAPNLTIVHGDALTFDLRDVDVVYTYALTHTVNDKLLPHFQTLARPGARLISYAFAIEAENVRVDHEEGRTKVYLFTQSA